MDHGGHSEMEGGVMSRVRGGRDDLCDNLPTTEPLTAQTGNLNETSALSQSLSLLQKGESGEQGLFHNAPFSNTGRSRDEEEEEEEEGNAEGNRDHEEEDLDELMKEEDEEEEDVSEGSSSIICCQSPDTLMTDSSYSETASLLETPYPFSPGTSPEPTSPVIPTATPETPHPISPASQSQSVVSVKPLTSSTESCSSRTGSVPGVESLTTWPADPATLTSHCSSPCSPKHTRITEHSTSSTQSVREFFTSSTPAFTVMADTAKLSASAGCTLESAATGPSLPLSLDSTSTTPQCSSSRGDPEDISGPMCDTGHVPDQDLLKSLEELAQRGDDAHLPQYLHQIAEAFVLKENFQWALWCIQLERLYHQRVLDNLNVLQEQWESQSKPTTSQLAAQHLDSLKHICQTHSRPRAKDAACVSLDILSSAAEEGGELSPRISDDQVDERMEARGEDSSHSESSHPILTSCEIADVESLDITKMKRKDPEREIVGREGFHRSQLTDRGGGEAGEAVGCTISVLRDELHPSTSVALEQPKPAEQQGGDLCLTQERQAKKEAGESRQERTVSTFKMDVEGEDEEEDKLRQRALPVETIVSGTEVEQEPLHPEALAGKSQLQESSESFVDQEASLPPDGHMKQQEDLDEEEYELEDADIIREASSLDDLAKLITVQEISPVSGLVSILKRRSETVDNESASKNTVTRSSIGSTKRRVRFKFPDDSYEQDVGGGDSCLLLFLLCLVTVVISLGGTALYCALVDVHSSVCQDFSRNADFYMNQIQRGISHIQHWFGPGS